MLILAALLFAAAVLAGVGMALAERREARTLLAELDADIERAWGSRSRHRP